MKVKKKKKKMEPLQPKWTVYKMEEPEMTMKMDG